MVNNMLSQQLGYILNKWVVGLSIPLNRASSHSSHFLTLMLLFSSLPDSIRSHIIPPYNLWSYNKVVV